MAHNAKYDRDDVLKEAFLQVGVTMIGDERWKCTMEMAGDHPRVPSYMSRGLDELLEHFGHKRREEDAKHDALNDCRLAAKIYMELCKKTKATRGSVAIDGFVEEESGESELEEEN